MEKPLDDSDPDPDPAAGSSEGGNSNRHATATTVTASNTTTGNTTTGHNTTTSNIAAFGPVTPTVTTPTTSLTLHDSNTFPFPNVLDDASTYQHTHNGAFSVMDTTGALSASPSYPVADAGLLPAAAGTGSGAGSSEGIPSPGIPSPGLQSPSHPVAGAVREKGRVRFNSTAASNRPVHVTVGRPVAAPPPSDREKIVLPPRPSILRGTSTGSIATVKSFSDGDDYQSDHRLDPYSIPLRNLQQQPGSSRAAGFGIGSHATWEEEDEDEERRQQRRQNDHQQDGEQHHSQQAAYDLVRSHTHRYDASANSHLSDHFEASPSPDESQPHHDIPASESNDGLLIYDGVVNVPAPEKYRGSVLSQLLKLYKPGESSAGAGRYGHHRNASSQSNYTTPGSESGTSTPSRRKWYEQNRSQETLANLIGASARLANPNMDRQGESSRAAAAGNGALTPSNNHKGHGNKKRPKTKRTMSNSRLSGLWQKEEARITVHIAETLSRQGYIIKLCRALMLFGAPTHRLEEYLSMTARLLEIDGQFLYLPGCMIISFDDRNTHTTEVQIVRSAQGIDLGKLKDVHHVYKEVMHDVIGVDEAIQQLETLITKREKFKPWWRVLVFGLTSATAAPFSFHARMIDLPLCFVFGCLVGLLQLIVSPKSSMYNNVFEVSATVVVSFLARAFGSLGGGQLFCFSAMAQSGIVMLLPGYSVLCSALELQSRAIVPGSIRIVYAIIYSLLIGFGITVGAALWGLFDSNATSEAVCTDPLNSLYGFIFVPFFVICISILYQAKWQQMPVMVVIATAGYVVNYFSSKRFAASPQIASTLGALAVGVLANLYSRVRHGVAAATLIPAIFTQVPGGLASTGGLLSGLTTANQLTNSTHQVNGTGSGVQIDNGNINGVVFQVAASMIQIAIGIAVGLFMSALIIYPLGKRRSGLFSF